MTRLQQMLHDLKEHGINPTVVTRLVRRQGLSVAYTTIHRIAHGSETTYTIGKAIESLHEHLLGDPAAAKHLKARRKAIEGAAEILS